MATTVLNPDDVGTPSWVESGAEEVKGLDLLGLREPVMRIGNSLLDGITTVTPSVRYLSFVTWIIWLYWRREGPDRRKDYLAFARRIEAALALGNVAFDRNTQGLIGADGDREALDDPAGVPLTLKVMALASAIYAGSAEQLGLLAVRPDSEVPHLTEARGLPLAEAVDDVLRATNLGRRLSDGELPDRVPLDELRAFGEVAHLEAIAPGERELLLSALLPENPISGMERNRLGTYGAFLALAGHGVKGERAIIDRAVQPRRELDRAMDKLLDGWVLYAVRDALAVTHECAMAAVLERLPRPADPGPAWGDSEAVLGAVLGEHDSLNSVLRDLGLLGQDEQWYDISFGQLDARLTLLTKRDAIVERGVRRWSNGLTEEDVIRVVRQTVAGAAVALPVAWLLAARRVEDGVLARQADFAALSREGHSRLGLEQVLIPALVRFRRDNPKLPEVVAELLSMTVEQHLRTAWSRLAVDSRKDVALLLVDGNRWARKSPLRPGQAASRLRQLAGWLRQLGLMADTGPTSQGLQVLERVRTSLAAPS